MIKRMGKLAAVFIAAAFSFAAHAESASPDQIVRTAIDEARADIAKNVATYQKDSKALYAMVDKGIVPHFDTEYIAKVILGAHLKAATPEQITAFGDAFKDMLIRTYADKLLEYYDGIEIEVKPAKIDGKRANVDTTIVRKDGKPPIPIQFSMRAADDGAWKIWDIKAENISLVLNYRTQLDAEIKSKGIPAVIERLRAGEVKLAEPAASATP